MAGWLATVVYGCVLFSAGGGLYVQYQQRFATLMSDRQARLQTGAEMIATSARIAAVEVDALAIAATMAITDRSAQPLPMLPDGPVGAGDDGGTMPMFQVPPGAGVSGRLTGRLHRDPDRAMVMAAEVAAVARIEPFMLQALRQLPEAAWIYYISDLGFLMLYPYGPSSQTRFHDDLLTGAVLTPARPAVNPTGRQFWTAPHDDAAGRVPVVTLVRPVLADDRFRGVIALDVTIAAIASMLRQIGTTAGTPMLVDDTGRIVATADAGSVGSSHAGGSVLPVAGQTAGQTIDAVWQAAGARGSFADTRAAGDDGTIRAANGMALFTRPIAGTPWTLVHGTDLRRTQASVLAMMWPEAVAALLLLSMLLALEVNRRTLRSLIRKRALLSARVNELAHAREDLARARDEAQAANHAKTAFLAHMSHELRTPLNAVIGMAEALKAQIFGPLVPKQMEYASDIANAGSHLLELINDLLDLARIEAGEATLDEEVVMVDDIVRPAIAMISARARKAGHVLHLMTPSRPVAISCDSRKLRQVLINLLTNAVKFTPDGGRISLVVRLMPDRSLTITVTDNGRGMALDEIPRALQPFRRIDSDPMVRRQEGAGLGLAIVSSFVALHDGIMQVNSTPGTGTSIAVHLPTTRVSAQ
ncbi:ATP-binding protein [Tistrella sp. BH-R2-4]|uniref:histidine kinase n=1 Tax=Tistrella arctica TaxID=3133430 RepID=A0ABU9YS00_9PROT